MAHDLPAAALEGYPIEDRSAVLKRMTCQVSGCVVEAGPKESLPESLKGWSVSLCVHHTTAIQNAIGDAVREAESLGMTDMEQVIALQEARILLYGSDNPRLKLLE